MILQIINTIERVDEVEATTIKMIMYERCVTKRTLRPVAHLTSDQSDLLDEARRWVENILSSLIRGYHCYNYTIIMLTIAVELTDEFIKWQHPCKTSIMHDLWKDDDEGGGTTIKMTMTDWYLLSFQDYHKDLMAWFCSHAMKIVDKTWRWGRDSTIKMTMNVSISVSSTSMSIMFA